MKRSLLILLVLTLFLVVLAGCAGDRTQEGSAAPGSRTAEQREAAHVDIDLSRLSSTLISAEMFNIFTNAEENFGKTIRVRGSYSFFHHEPTDSYYHMIITVEGDECCWEGFEFKWTGNHVFPDDYPALGTRIELDGIFSVETTGDSRYFYLQAKDIFILG